MKTVCILASSFFVLAACANAQKERVLPKDLPPYGSMVPFSAPVVKTFQLDNGLTAWLVPRTGFPKVALVLAVRGGLAADPNDRPGLAELLANSLTQGTKTRSARQIAEQVQDVGGDLSARAEQDSIVLTLNVLADKFTQVMPVLADVAANANFPDNEVAIAKRNVSNLLRAREAEPRFLASRALARVMFRGHPYGVIAPTQGAIEQATPEELRNEFARRFQPKQSLLVVVGSFDLASAENTIRQAFQSWKSVRDALLPDTPKPSIPAPNGVFVVTRPGSVQTTLQLGTPGPLRRDSDYEAAQLANMIYGGMFGSRLVLNIREDKGYTYSPRSNLRTYREAGVLVTQADVRNPVTGATLNEINYELNRMCTTNPTDSEMTQAKRYIVGVEAIRLQSGAGLAGELAGLWIDGLSPDEIARHTEKIEKSTVADVTAAARKYFPAARAAVVAVGEEKLVEEELRPFGMEIKPAP
jgi:zinc protease